jgi:hypothetical protein
MMKTICFTCKRMNDHALAERLLRDHFTANAALQKRYGRGNGKMTESEFQQSCEVALAAALALLGRRLVDRSEGLLRQSRMSRLLIGACDEHYVRVGISGSPDVSIYIYIDGAELHSNGRRGLSYEREDFRSLQELQTRFVADVIAKIG